MTFPTYLSAASRFDDEGLTDLRRARRVRMARDDEPDFRECLCDLQLLLKGDVRHSNIEIGKRPNLRQGFAHGLDERS